MSTEAKPEQRVFAGGQSRLVGPLAMLVARPVLAVVAQAAVAALYRRRRHPAAWRAAARWWMVYASAVDLGCTAALAILARVEGTTLRSAAGFGTKPRRAVSAAAMDLIGLVPAAVLSQLIGRPLGNGDPYPEQIRVAATPLWATAYSITLWPVVWAAAEDATYLGYVLPRLDRSLNNPALASTVTALFWAAQHAVMPVLPGRRYALSRVVTMLPVAAAFIMIFRLRGQRLAPIVVGHWLSDASTAILAAVVTRQRRAVSLIESPR